MPASRTAWPHWRVRGGRLAEVPQEKEWAAGLACGAVEGTPAAPTERKGQFSVATGDGGAGGGDVPLFPVPVNLLREPQSLLGGEAEFPA